MLNDKDLHRYARQVIIPNFDEEGQEKLLKTKCLPRLPLGWPKRPPDGFKYPPSDLPDGPK